MGTLHRHLFAAILALGFCTPAHAQERAESSCADDAVTAAVTPPAGPVAVAPARSIRWHDLTATGVVVLTALGGLFYVRVNERRRRVRLLSPDTLIWAPYVTGALMGLLITASMVLFGRPVGASGAIQNVAGVAGRWLTPGNGYWGKVIPIGLTWQVWVLLGLGIGGLVGADLSGEFAVTTIPPRGWVDTWGRSRITRWAIAFGAAALIEFASAIAGGCTSGLALSGGIVLSPAAFAFMIAMFATGVPTALLVSHWRGR